MEQQAEVLGSIWTHWHGHIEVLVGLGLLEIGYLLGVGPLRERYKLAEYIDPRRIAIFTSGVLVIFLALLSPLHELSDVYLFSAHMTQHVLLTLVAPPLLILGTPGWLMRRVLWPKLAFNAVRYITKPVPALAIFNLMFALWHVPALYDLSMTYHVIHILEHLLFISTALVMWWPLTSTMPELPRISYPLQMLYLFVLSIAQIIVFVFVTFSSQPLYEWYVDAPKILGISTLQDQQIGGIIMKVGSGILFLLLIVLAFFRWYGQEEKKTKAEKEERGRSAVVDKDGLQTAQ